MSRIPTRLILINILSLCGCLVSAGGASAAAAPAWQVTASSYPTNFAPGTTGTGGQGPGYTLVARNVGGAPISGEFKISDVLPAGVSVSPEKEPYGNYGASGFAAKKLSCESSGGVVTCSGNGPLYP